MFQCYILILYSDAIFQCFNPVLYSSPLFQCCIQVLYSSPLSWSYTVFHILVLLRAAQAARAARAARAYLKVPRPPRPKAKAKAKAQKMQADLTPHFVAGHPGPEQEGASSRPLSRTSSSSSSSTTANTRHHRVLSLSHSLSRQPICSPLVASSPLLSAGPSAPLPAT